MNPIQLTKAQFRLFLLTYQGLLNENTSDLRCDSIEPIESIESIDAIETIVKRLGCIQYDPLNVVGKNPDLVLQARIKGYRQGDIDKLLYEKRSLIDAWDKMMAIYSAMDFPYFTRLRERKALEIQSVLRFRGADQAIDYCKEALEIVGKQGPLQANQIDFGVTEKGRWGHGKLSSATLDYLFNIGRLGIHSKRNTQKIYDLIENLLPDAMLDSIDPFETEESFTKWYIKRRIGGFGAYWSKSGGGWLGHFIDKSEVRKRLIKEMVHDGDLLVIRVEDIKEPFYMRSEDLHYLENAMKTDIGAHRSTVKFIAPLDNFLWDREMIRQVFNFDYVWEVYKPVHIRKYGYYVLPVLYGDRIVARFEPKLFRSGNAFTIEHWWWEADVDLDENLMSACRQGIENFAKYLGAMGINDYNINNRE